MTQILRRVGSALSGFLLTAGYCERLAWGLWAALLVMGIGRAALYSSPKHQGCYHVFVGAARHWLHSVDLYDHTDANSLQVFRYSPLTAVTLAPLGHVSDPLGSGLLRALSFLVFLTSFHWWCRTMQSGGPSREGRAIAWLLCAGMGGSAFLDVQLNLLTAGCILMTLAAVARSRWNLAALTISFAICLKAYPVALALVLSALFPRRFAPRWLAAISLCLLMPFLFQRPDYVARQYADWVTWGLNQRSPLGGVNAFQDMGLVSNRWLMPMDRTTYLVLEVVAGVLVALACLRRFRQGLSPESLLLTIAGLCVGWMTAFGPATEAQTYVQLAPIAAVFALFVWQTTCPRWSRVAVTSACILLTLAQFQLIFPLDRPLHYLAVQPIAALLLMSVAAFGLPPRMDAAVDAERNTVPSASTASVPRRAAA